MAGDSRRQERSDLGEFAHGQFRVDYEHRPDPEALRRLRIERARAAMEEAGLDGLLLWTTENVRYLAGLRPQLITGKSIFLNGCLLLPETEPIALLSGGEAERARIVMPWIEELHVVPIMEAAGLIRGAWSPRSPRSWSATDWRLAGSAWTPPPMRRSKLCGNPP